MKLSYFIAGRISKNDQGSFSTVINKIAIVSITLALAALICSYMILRGFESTIKEKIYSFSGHLIVSKYTLSTSFEQSSITVDDSLIQELKALPGIAYMQSFAYKAGLLNTSEEVQGIIFKGVDDNFDVSSFQAHMLDGTFPNISASTDYSLEIAVSAKIARKLKLKVGEEVMAFFAQNPPRYRKLLVTGIYETGLEDFDEKVVLGDLKLVQRLNDWSPQTAGGVEIFLDDPEDMDEAETLVFDNTDADLYVDKVSDKYIQIFDWLRLLDRNVIVFFTLVLFVASFNMVSILFILIMERTKMIGLLKALGADNSLIEKIFFFNGLNLILRGVFWGNLVGLGFCLLQQKFKFIPLDAANYYMDHVPITMHWGVVGLINVFVVFMIALALTIPLGVISRINPIRSIRFD